MSRNRSFIRLFVLTLSWGLCGYLPVGYRPPPNPFTASLGKSPVLVLVGVLNYPSVQLFYQVDVRGNKAIQQLFNHAVSREFVTVVDTADSERYVFIFLDQGGDVLASFMSVSNTRAIRSVVEPIFVNKQGAEWKYKRFSEYIISNCGSIWGSWTKAEQREVVQTKYIPMGEYEALLKNLARGRLTEYQGVPPQRYDAGK